MAKDSTPIPIAAAARPNKIIAVAKPIKIGTTGPNSKPATPNMANVATNAPRPIASFSRDILPSRSITEANMFNASAAITIAIAPGIVPFMRFRLSTSIPKDIPIASKPFANASQLSPPILTTASEIAPKASPTITSDAALISMSLGIKRIAPPIISSAPAMPSKPLTRPSVDILPIVPIASANFCIAMPRIIIDVAVSNKLPPLPLKRENNPTSSSNAPIAVTP